MPDKVIIIRVIWTLNSACSEEISHPFSYINLQVTLNTLSFADKPLNVCIFKYFGTFTFFFLSDMNHFSSRVQKAASRDMWDIGLLIHNIFIADVTREEMIWMLSLQCSHFDTQLIEKTFVNRPQLCSKCRWWPHIFFINCNINIPDICNSWLAQISLFSGIGLTLNLLTWYKYALCKYRFLCWKTSYKKGLVCHRVDTFICVALKTLFSPSLSSLTYFKQFSKP